jgi:hypothetical protein
MLPNENFGRPDHLRPAIARAKRAEKRATDPDERDAASAEAERLRADLAAAKIAAYVEKIVAAAPPLTDDQRRRLAVLLLQQPLDAAS